MPISENLQAEIDAWRGKYDHLPVRWLAGKNLHITLIPPWYEEDVQSVIDKLKQAGEEFAPFQVLFEKVEFGPDTHRPRLIWAEGEAPKELIELKQKVEETLIQGTAARPESAKRESRLFRLHLTLARFRPETFSSFPVKRLNEKVCWRDRIESFVLLESHLSPGGADYEILETYGLRRKA